MANVATIRHPPFVVNALVLHAFSVQVRAWNETVGAFAAKHSGAIFGTNSIRIADVERTHKVGI